jgi:hypothetical protein
MLPFDRLWKLVRSFKVHFTQWTKELPIFRLIHEDLDSITRGMIKSADKLKVQFRDMQVEKEKS